MSNSVILRLEHRRLAVVLLTPVNTANVDEALYTTLCKACYDYSDSILQSCGGYKLRVIDSIDFMQCCLFLPVYQKFSVADILDLSPILFTPPTRTRQDKAVVSVSAV